VTFGCWLPQARRSDEAFLEIWRPQAPVDLGVPEQCLRFTRQLVPLLRCGEYHWCVIDGMCAGRRDQLGDLYRVRYRDVDGAWQLAADPLADSIPFGPFAPAELYDMAHLHRYRGDRGYFAERGAAEDVSEADIPTIGPPATMLQLHVPTASAGGTLASLARRYRAIADKLRAGQDLSAADRAFIGYEAVQLLPIEPTIVHEAGPAFWQPASDDPTDVDLDVRLRRPDTVNWGYDAVICGASAVNPALLERGRPDELIDLCEVLHTFPGGPIALVLDMVFGHADNQALALLPPPFFAGPNMYGQSIAYRHPVVRALLLEMQRRKVDFGVDGVRVDGAQDFTYWDEDAGELHHDDDFLAAMSGVIQNVAGRCYRPWMVFEDGRPWPQKDWELASSYREVIAQQPDAFQWGPLTFAHNTPFVPTFWISKWWRLEEVARRGERWITGCANHDTLRRGIQVDVETATNDHLGNTPLAIMAAAYDNPAQGLLNLFLPGVPMDFINASLRAPWAFVRNTDHRYGLKVAAEEAGFLGWRVDEARFESPGVFSRIRALGFRQLSELRAFMRALRAALPLAVDDPDALARILGALMPAGCAGSDSSPDFLRRFARAWMDDVHELCNVAAYEPAHDPIRARFLLRLRELRRSHRWLASNLGPDDIFAHRQPCNGAVLVYGRRHSPAGNTSFLLVANMEGAAVTIVPTALPLGMEADGWHCAAATPGVEANALQGALTLRDSEGVLFQRDEAQAAS
jgi:hypothetical protein